MGEWVWLGGGGVGGAKMVFFCQIVRLDMKSQITSKQHPCKHANSVIQQTEKNCHKEKCGRSCRKKNVFLQERHCCRTRFHCLTDGKSQEQGGEGGGLDD